MKIFFRLFEATDEEYQAIVAVQNGVWPEFPDTIEKRKHWDKARPPGYFFERLVVEVDGKIVAYEKRLAAEKAEAE
jgi:hypothetical protein